MSATATVVLVCTDLMLVSSVSGAAASCGLRCVQVRHPGALQLDELSGPVLVCVDLASPGVQPGLLAEMLSPDVLATAIAFGPHVHRDKLDAARTAGFGRVMSRRQFVMSLPGLFAPLDPFPPTQGPGKV